uniref:Uncharacterized protein n=1 Tax=uncultured Desulfobacterium sp. TaxID=201089 RepID=E1YL28_9BACT|nr:unknown protein [uncultured Desulfobacterium sp.]
MNRISQKSNIRKQCTMSKSGIENEHTDQTKSNVINISNLIIWRK